MTDDGPGRPPRRRRDEKEPGIFHVVVRRTPGTWDALLGLVERHELSVITSEHRPDGVAPGRWCTYVLARRLASGREIAGRVTAALDDDGAAMAMISELAAGGGWFR